MQPLLQGGIAACIRLRERRYLPKFEKIPPQQNFMSWTRRLNCGWMNWFSAWFHQRNYNKKISEVNTVAFLPTARIFKDLEGVYLLENNGRGERIWTSDPPGPEPESRTYWTLWKLPVSKRLILNLLWASGHGLLFFIEVGGFRRLNFAYTV